MRQRWGVTQPWKSLLWKGFPGTCSRCLIPHSWHRWREVSPADRRSCGGVTHWWWLMPLSSLTCLEKGSCPHCVCLPLGRQVSTSQPLPGPLTSSPTPLSPQPWSADSQLRTRMKPGSWFPWLLTLEMTVWWFQQRTPELWQVPTMRISCKRDAHTHVHAHMQIIYTYSIHHMHVLTRKQYIPDWVFGHKLLNISQATGSQNF